MAARGVDVTPHHHEASTSGYTYADVNHLLGDLNVTGGGITVGGFNRAGTAWLDYDEGIDESATGAGTWYPQLLWGASRDSNHANDNYSSGVWRPQGRYTLANGDTYFLTHNDEGQLPYLGGACANIVEPETTVGEVIAIVEDIYDQTDDDELWTHRITIHQRNFDNDGEEDVEAYIDLVQHVITSVNNDPDLPDVVRATPAEILDIWENEFIEADQGHHVGGDLTCP